MLNEEELKDAALLVFANKQDQPGAKGAGEISEALRLGELRDRNWSIMACSAVDGSGVNEGMDWLVVRANSRAGCSNPAIRVIFLSSKANWGGCTANRIAGVRNHCRDGYFVLPFRSDFVQQNTQRTNDTTFNSWLGSIWGYTDILKV